MAKDLYQILGVTKTADAKEIKTAYRELAKKLHPDRNPDDPAAEERFKEVSAAFAVLSDAEKRSAYDEFGADGLRQGFDPDAARNYQRWAGGRRGAPGGGGFEFNFGGPGGGGLGGFGDLDELLSGMFGGGGGRRARPRPSKGANLEGEALISLRQALEGCELSVQGGTVRVPEGAKEGQRLRVRGKGAEGPAGRGDLLLTLSISTPPGYTRDGDDLTLDVPITLRQAVVGGTVEVPSPEGTTLSLSVPEGTQSGRRVRIRDRGIPAKAGRGHFYARFMIAAPKASDDPALATLLDDLERFYED